MSCSPSGSSVHGILQARILEWVGMPSARGSSQQGSNQHLLGLLHWQADSLPLVPPRSPECHPGGQQRCTPMFTKDPFQDSMLLRMAKQWKLHTFSSVKFSPGIQGITDLLNSFLEMQKAFPNPAQHPKVSTLTLVPPDH